MPNVPIADSNRIQERGFASPRFSAAVPKVEDSTGSFKAAAGVADIANAIADKEQKSANDAKLIDVDSQLTKYKNDQLWDDKTGAYSQKGENALNVVDSYGEAYQKKADELYATLNNDDQRAMFKQRSTQIGNEFRLDLEKHTFTEGKKLEDEKYKLGEATYRGDAILNFHDPKKVQSNMALIEGLVLSKASKDGITDPELIQTLVSEARSSTHAGIIERASNMGQDQYAQAYFDKVKGELGDKLPAIEKTLQEATTLGNAQRNRNEIVSQNLDMAGALELARKEKNPKVQEKTVELTKQYYSEKAAASEQAQKQLAADVFNQIDASHLDGMARYDSLPASTKASLSPENKKSAMGYAEQTHEPAPNGETYQKYLYLLKNPDTRESVVVDPKDKPLMRSSEFKDVLELSSKDQKSTDKLDYLWPIEKIKRDAANKAGLGGWFSSDIEPSPEGIQFNALFDRSIKQKEQAVGRSLTNDEASEVANRLTTQAVVSRYGLHQLAPTKAVGVLKPSDLSIDEIPLDIRNQIVAGRKLTDEQVIKAYIKGLQTGVIKPNAE